MTDHERALAAAEQACKAWDSTIQPAVLERIVADARNAAFEEAAKAAETAQVPGSLLRPGIAKIIRSLKTPEGADADPR